jgi:hypothetical protein
MQYCEQWAADDRRRSGSDSSHHASDHAARTMEVDDYLHIYKFQPYAECLEEKAANCVMTWSQLPHSSFDSPSAIVG